MVYARKIWLMIYFLHGNGFPSGCYQQFLEHLGYFDTVFAEPVLTSPVECQPKKRWAAMRDQASSRIESLLIKHAKTDAQLTLVGHSMGGYLQMMAAKQIIQKNAANADRIKDIVLIDSPFPQGYRQALLAFIQTTGLTHKFGPAPIAAKRRTQWATLDEAKTFFASKKFTQNWAPGVIDDFVNHALTKIKDRHFTLTIPRETERDIYAFITAKQAREALVYLRQRKISPAFVAGNKSLEVSLGGRASNYRLFADRLIEIESGHLIPMEQPIKCARAVAQLLNITAKTALPHL
jgi:pimeloyl-ACP methyl ester carboxylesterase